MTPNWLPELILFQDYGGNWDQYLDALYSWFKRDFVESASFFEGQKIRLKRHPISKGKEATFWHIISKGLVEEDRFIDLRRCERIRWPRAIIDNARDHIVKVWKNIRKGEPRVCLWLEADEYLVILVERKGYVLLWTAYTVTRPHHKRKLEKEYRGYWKNKKALKG